MTVYRFKTLLVAGFVIFSLSLSVESVDKIVESSSNINNILNIKHVPLFSDNEFESSNLDQSDCNYGSNSKSCMIKDGLKYCTCKKGYVPGINEVCTEMCNDSRPCDNGGTCNEGLCVCPPRTKGTFCEEIYVYCGWTDVFEMAAQVRGLRCCCTNNKTVRARCKYDIKIHNPYCECQNESEVYEDNSETCKECNCGETSTWTKCDFYNGVKTCFCARGYEYNPSTQKCDICDCGNSSKKCEFSGNGAIKCKCRQGFRQYKNKCRECNCGLNGFCEFREGVPTCRCVKGFQNSNGTCIECDCGKFGECIFNETGKKTSCACEPGYSESSVGKCEYCYCGDNAVCSFDSSDKRNCSCPYGYIDINGFCRDIDECESSDPCPAKERCINLPGSYICGCAGGYHHTSEGCTDINECVNVDICGPNECVNTPGSYECRCKLGYLSRGGQKDTLTCQSDSSSKIGYGILTTLFAIIVIGLLVVLYRSYKQKETSNINYNRSLN